jgi:nucleotide-binding universal stress UspA family protein
MSTLVESIPISVTKTASALAKILIPVDYSERSQTALDYAARLADRFHGEVIVLHVIDDPSTASRWPAQHQLEAFLPEEMRRRNVRAVILAGDPATNILEFAEAEKVDLIVISTHGYGPVGRAVHGSVTAAVLDGAGCPVLTGVNLEPRDAQFHMDRVVCAVNACADAKVPRWASRFATAFDASLYLDAACDGECGCSPEHVCKHAGELHADLLVIGRTHPHGLWEKLQSDADTIISHAPCAVLSV